jgi:hypothetical protein
MSSILSGYLLLSFRAELAQFDAEVILVTNKVVQETRDGYPFAIENEMSTEYVVRSLSILQPVSGLGSD